MTRILCKAGLCPESPSYCIDGLQCESQKPFSPPASVSWLHVLRKQITDKSTTLTAETHRSTCTLMTWYEPILASGNCAWSWRLCGINPTIQIPI